MLSIERAALPPFPIGLFLERKPTETLVKLGNTATSVKHRSTTASPCWVRCRVDFQGHRVALFAPGGASFKHSSVGHLDLDHVVIGMDIFFHVGKLLKRSRFPTGSRKIGSAALNGDFGELQALDSGRRIGDHRHEFTFSRQLIPDHRLPCKFTHARLFMRELHIQV
jgi:hypothetical protein